MCGIFGMISKKTRPFNKRAFCTMGARNDSRGGDSCGVFIDGQVEYGVDEQKMFISFFRDSVLLNTTKECRVALGHCRKASVGKVSVETAQPVVLKNEQGQVDFVLIHNGTIYNYKDLAKKYIPDVNIDGLTDSQVMARIFYHKGYDALDEYNGGAVFVIHDYRINRTLVFKGASKKYKYSKDAEEERPLYYCWHNGRFVFSSIFETLYAFYYEEKVYNFPCNKLLAIKGEHKVKLIKSYDRENVTQSKSTFSTYFNVNNPRIWDEYDDYYYGCYGSGVNKTYKIKYDGINYLDENGEPMHGVFQISSFGYVYPNRTVKETWLEEVGFFRGKMLKHPNAFKLLNDMYQKANNVVTNEIDVLTNMMDFNPYSDDCVQYYWYDGDVLMIPQGEWKWPMADYSAIFNKEGIMVQVGTTSYGGWTKDYHMYTYEEDKILESLKKLCEGEQFIQIITMPNLEI